MLHHLPRDKSSDARTCWLWSGPVKAFASPLPVVGYRGQQLSARRLVHEVFASPVPKGFKLVAVCGNPLCVNPWHSNSVFLTVPDALPEEDPANEMLDLIESLPPEQRSVEAILALDLGFDEALIRQVLTRA